MISMSASPETTSPRSFFSLLPASLRISRMASSIIESSSSLFLGYSSKSFISSVSNAQEKPMVFAVSILSPVSTQTLMPAFLSCKIVSGTCSCNLSSIAVAPTIERFTSSSSCSSSICCARPSIRFFASSYFSFQIRNSSRSSLRCPSTSVLRPSTAMWSSLEARSWLESLQSHATTARSRRVSPGRRPHRLRLWSAETRCQYRLR